MDINEWLANEEEFMNHFKIAENYIPSREKLIEIASKLLVDYTTRKKAIENHTIGLLDPQKYTVYSELKVPFKMYTSKRKMSKCTFCLNAIIYGKYKLKAKNCKRCNYCPTCVNFYTANIGHSSMPGYYDDKDKSRLCYDFDCCSRIRKSDAEGRPPQCARRRNTYKSVRIAIL
jgi:hypothetical protein